MSDDVVYVPRVIEYDDNEPLGVEGTVIAVLSSSRSNRRITVLVEEPAERFDDGDSTEAPEGVEVPGIDVRYDSVEEAIEEMGYRDLQSVAGELGIKANQSQEDLEVAVLEKLN